jgi:peptidylprolyl isomerase domain and WD repeat-containing protein 1
MIFSFSGIKLVNLYTNKCVRVIGKSENFRCVHIALCQAEAVSGPASVEETASENPNLQVKLSEPTLVCTAYKKNRFYLFTRYANF